MNGLKTVLKRRNNGRLAKYATKTVPFGRHYSVMIVSSSPPLLRNIMAWSHNQGISVSFLFEWFQGRRTVDNEGTPWYFQKKEAEEKIDVWV